MPACPAWMTKLCAAAGAPGVADRAGEDRVHRPLDHRRQAEEPGASPRSPSVGSYSRTCGISSKSRVRAVDVDAVVRRPRQLQHGVGDALRRLAGVVAGEHAVDVGAVERPAAAARVDAQDVDGRDDDDAPHRADARAARPAATRAKKVRQARQHEDAVQLVAVNAGDQCQRRRRGRAADVVVRDLEVLAQRRGHPQQGRWRHLRADLALSAPP